ncbi:MAG: hydantoinase/oxoprolinase family protein [Deltaproteobacteria bacterium]|jgi:N-methylhydantoinase A/oxoprolinase/acetone carboxylase beta subunit|nr:hydantoinase/oxoprolinase family protein [Deltaproteobacteria bacterium]MBW2481388.1 hydantoinase/oxoprolinase family protein [Deltaproteobacteria bacterium]
MKRVPKVMAIDAGGTMTDNFVIDARGEFVVGKAQTTPTDESIGFTNSFIDALRFWGMNPEEAFPTIKSGVYSGTAMINRLLERKGSRVGLLVTAGMEDALILERGVQTHLDFSYSDKLHIATHYHNLPLIPREQIKGIPERIDLFGETAIPINEAETRKRIRELLALDIDSLCICLLHSYRNPVHEMVVQEIAEKVMQENDCVVPIYLSSELYPIRGDLPRLNTLLIDAYAAEPSREQIQKIRQKTKDQGATFELRIMATHGGTISTESKELARTLISGPIGGLVGGRHLASQLGYRNVVCTDIGGTSFDIGLITEGDYGITPYPEIARFVLSLPLAQINSVGAGTGSYIRINPTNNRVEIGPDSAGARIGVCYKDGGVQTPTITDCHVILGYIDPNYFLGGEVKLDPERARRAIEEQIARPLDLEVARAAEGVIAILEENLKTTLHATIVGKGYSPMNYTLLNYGGGGPLHVGGMSKDMGFEEILIPSWAAGFSAYGCSCADYEYRSDISIDLPLEPGVSKEEKSGIVDLINGQAAFLQAKVMAEFEKSGIAEEQIEYTMYMRIQYLGQLNDLEVRCGKAMFEGPEDLDKIIDEFEELYGKVYALAAKSPELGYLLTTLVVAGSVEVEKPRLPAKEIQSKDPSPAAGKGLRPVYWQGEWIDTQIFEMDRLEPGNMIRGLAVIEAPSTTLVVPPERYVFLDQNNIFHMGEEV